MVNTTESADIKETRSIEQSNGHAVQPQLIATPYWGGQDDEVSLVDIALVVLKHKKVLCTLFVLVAGIGSAAIFLMPAQYKYAVVIETGTYALPDEHGNLGGRKVIEPVVHTKSKLETSFIPQAVMQFANDNPTLKAPELTVTVPKGANLIEISAKAPESKDALVKALLTDVANKVAIDHQRKSSDVLEELRQNVEVMEINVQELSAKLVDKEQARQLTALKLKNLEAEKGLLSRQTDRIDGEIAELQKHRALYLDDRARSKDALALLLIDNEISQSARQRDELENQLHIELAEEKAELEKVYDSEAAQISIVKAELSRAKEILSRYSASSVSNPNDTGGAPLVEMGKNIYPTTLSVNPYREVEPQGIGRLVKLAIVFVLALFVSLMMTFVAEFVSRVRSAE